jgi:transcriptional regulator with XRE-family HTH domain
MMTPHKEEEMLMDQIKVGKFIAACRKKQGLTQLQLAEKMNITDRAVSKWETGKTMPDSAIMLELCDVLGITVNDLLNGEHISSENYAKKMEEQLLEMVEQKQASDKRLMKLSYFLMIIGGLAWCLGSWVNIYTNYSWTWYWIVEAAFFVMFTLCILVGAKLDQQAGYYCCCKCETTYKPSFNQIWWALEWGKKKYMRCPHCKKLAGHLKTYKK